MRGSMSISPKLQSGVARHLKCTTLHSARPCYMNQNLKYTVYLHGHSLLHTVPFPCCLSLASLPTKKLPDTWVCFDADSLSRPTQGKLVNETRCLRCETVTSREEAFYDLSLEIEQNSSLTACLKNFR